MIIHLISLKAMEDSEGNSTKEGLPGAQMYS